MFAAFWLTSKHQVFSLHIPVLFGQCPYFITSPPHFLLLSSPSSHCDPAAPKCLFSPLKSGCTPDMQPPSSPLHLDVDVMMNVVVCPRYFVCRDECSRDVVVSFSSTGFKIKSSTGSFEFQWELDAIIDIGSQWCGRAGVAVVYVHVISKDAAQVGSPCVASRIEGLTFAVFDANWPERQEEITSLHEKFKSAWKVINDTNLDGSASGEDNFVVSNNYFPKIEMTTLPTSSLRSSQCENDSSLVSREFSEPRTTTGSFLDGQYQSFDQTSFQLKNVMSPIQGPTDAAMTRVGSPTNSSHSSRAASVEVIVEEGPAHVAMAISLSGSHTNSSSQAASVENVAEEEPTPAAAVAARPWSRLLFAVFHYMRGFSACGGAILAVAALETDRSFMTWAGILATWTTLGNLVLAATKPWFDEEAKEDWFTTLICGLFYTLLGSLVPMSALLVGHVVTRYILLAVMLAVNTAGVGALGGALSPAPFLLVFVGYFLLLLVLYGVAFFGPKIYVDVMG